jgi:hemerythrin superfamily protein
MQDHREVERLFDELKDNPEKRPNLVPVLTTLLSAHSRAEESAVYPAAAEEADQADDVAHNQQEHIEADQPQDITRDELLQQARNADVAGASSLGKDELKKKLQQEASE